MAQFYSPKRRVMPRETLIVTVTELDPFGQGVARHKGKALFIPGALPGEEVEVVLVEDKKQYARGKVKKILQPSDARQTPLCPWFGRCGGCQQQHAAPALQQTSKAQALSHLLKRETAQALPEVTVLAGEPWGYRRRARLGLHYDHRERQLTMGFRKAGSHDLIQIDHCPVLKPKLSALLKPLYQCLSGLQTISRPGHVELVLADNGPLLVLRHLAPLSESDSAALNQFCQQHQVALWLAPESDELVQQSGEAPSYQIAGLTLGFSARDFIQVNGELNQQMVAQAIDWLEIAPTDRVLDLFCGMGNFTLPLAQRAEQVVGVEGVAALVEQATANARNNQLPNARFFLHNLEAPLHHQPWAQEGFNKVLLDPARAGAANVMTHVVKLRPSHVVYVSCNAATLARDSQTLLAAGYRMAKVAMLDMFPHTSHLESMVLFTRS